VSGLHTLPAAPREHKEQPATPLSRRKGGFHFQATVGRFDAAADRALFDELARWVEDFFREDLKRRPSKHVYIRKLPADVIAKIDCLRDSAVIRSAMLEQFAPNSKITPMKHTDELYISHYNKDFGGDQGLDVLATVPGFLGPAFPLTRWIAWLTCAFALVALVLLANLAHSRVGRSWRALRDDEVAASLAGLNVGRLQVLAFVVSAACAGLGGALLATWAASASPGEFSLTLSIGLLTAVVLGGLGSLPGALWGSLVLVLVPGYLTNLGASHGLSGGASASVPIAVYGIVLILVMLLFPAGIQGGIRRFLGPAAPVAAVPFSAWRRRGPAREHQEKGVS